MPGGRHDSQQLEDADYQDCFLHSIVNKTTNVSTYEPRKNSLGYFNYVDVI